jgi:hypothetical protein
LASNPFVVLLREGRPDEADDRPAIGEDPEDVGPAADLFVQALLGFLDRIFDQCSTGKALKANTSVAASSKKSAASMNPVSVSFETTLPRRSKVAIAAVHTLF